MHVSHRRPVVEDHGRSTAMRVRWADAADARGLPRYIEDRRRELEDGLLV
jgi:hypothetical protein